MASKMASCLVESSLPNAVNTKQCFERNNSVFAEKGGRTEDINKFSVPNHCFYGILSIGILFFWSLVKNSHKLQQTNFCCNVEVVRIWIAYPNSINPTPITTTMVLKIPRRPRSPNQLIFWRPARVAVRLAHCVGKQTRIDKPGAATFNKLIFFIGNIIYWEDVYGKFLWSRLRWQWRK